MKKMKKVGLLLGIGFMLVNNVSAKEMVITEKGILFDEENKTIVSVDEGTKVNSIDGLENHKGYYVNYNNKKYFVPNDGLTSPENYSGYEEYVNSHKPKVTISSNNYVYEKVNFETNDPWIKKVVNNYKPVGKNDSEIFMNLNKYILGLNLKYQTGGSKDQLESMKDGYTACYGITCLQRLLLDKSNLKYRVVYSLPINYDTYEADPSNPRHIFMEVKVDGKWRLADGTYLQTNPKKVNQEKKDDKFLYDSFMKNERDYKNNIYARFNSNKDFPDVEYLVSGTYQAGKKIEDNGFNAKHSTIKFLPSNFKVTNK